MEHFNFNNQTPASPDCSCSKCPPPGCSCGQCVQFLYTINGLVTQSTSSSTDNLPTVALVAPVLLLAALPGEVPEPVALVALAAATSAESSGHAPATAAASAVTVHATISLGTLASKVAYSVTPAAEAPVMVWHQIVHGPTCNRQTHRLRAQPRLHPGTRGRNVQSCKCTFKA